LGDLIDYSMNDKLLINQEEGEEEKAIISKNKPFAKLDLLLGTLQILLHQYQLSGDLISVGFRFVRVQQQC
jgi:hypothetical protein